jgi:uncharacterized repeat protein (TIGR04138 family)
MSERLERSIEELAREDRRFPPAAYMLVFEGLERALAKLPARRHVTPRELVDGVREVALKEWGLLARTVLESWNIQSSGEIGDIVFNLIEKKLLVAGAQDSRAQFEEALDFDEGLDRAFLAGLEKDPPKLVAARG